MKLSISTNSRPNTIWTANSKIDNIFKLCIKYRTICSMPAAVNSSPAHLYDDTHPYKEQEHKQPLPQLHLHFHWLSATVWLFCADREQWVEGGAEVTAVSVWEREIVCRVLEWEKVRSTANGDSDVKVTANWGWNGGVTVPTVWQMWVKWGGSSNRCCCSSCVADVGEMGG